MKRKRLYAVLALTAAILLATCPTTFADAVNSLKILVNDKQVVSSARIMDGQVYVPLDVLNENLGIKAEYSSESKTVKLSDSDQDISSIVKKVNPSVVGVIGNMKQTTPGYNLNENYNMIFGTGVILKSNGYIITNAHVVKDMENIIVILYNSKAYEARLKAIDEKTDLAMIKIDKGELIPAVLGDISEIHVGEPVIAIGTPLSLSLMNSASKGIISGINRSVQSDYRFIQSDASINGGNSGGPLVNMKGDVIGINSIKYTGIGVEGLSFSIPVDTVEYAFNHFMKYGRIKRPYLGAGFDEGIAAMYGLPSNEGLTITSIEGNSSAQKAGLKLEDILLAVNSINITTKVDYNEEMKKFLPGDSAEFLIKRGEKNLKLKVTFSEEPFTN